MYNQIYKKNMDRLVQFPSSDRSIGVNNSSPKIKITRPTNPVQVLVPSPAESAEGSQMNGRNRRQQPMVFVHTGIHPVVLTAQLDLSSRLDTWIFNLVLNRVVSCL